MYSGNALNAAAVVHRQSGPSRHLLRLAGHRTQRRRDLVVNTWTHTGLSNVGAVLLPILCPVMELLAANWLTG